MTLKEQENERLPGILMSPKMKAFEKVISYLKIIGKGNKHGNEEN